MGEPALVLYGTGNGTYDVHHSQWGGHQLRLLDELGPTTPRGTGAPDDITAFLDEVEAHVRDETDGDDVVRYDDLQPNPDESVSLTPLLEDAAMDEALRRCLEMGTQAVYLVDHDFGVAGFTVVQSGGLYVGESMFSGDLQQTQQIPDNETRLQALLYLMRPNDAVLVWVGADERDEILPRIRDRTDEIHQRIHCGELTADESRADLYEFVFDEFGDRVPEFSPITDPNADRVAPPTPEELAWSMPDMIGGTFG